MEIDIGFENIFYVKYSETKFIQQNLFTISFVLKIHTINKTTINCNAIMLKIELFGYQFDSNRYQFEWN